MKKLNSPSISGRLVFLTMLLAPAIASAHPGLPGHTHGFANGIMHPLSGLDHMLAMTAVGLLAVQRGGKAIWMMPLAFVSAMVFGGMLGMMGWGEFPLLEQAIAATVFTMGIMMATATRMPLSSCIPMVGLFALFHGYAHGAEMPATSSGLLYGLGFILATAFLHVCGISMGLAAQKLNSMKFVRYSGLLIAACGIYLIFTA
jgi:urease accessory protein